MRQSIYIILATTLIKMDIHHEQRKIRKQQRAVRYETTHLSHHLMRDIGLQADGFDVGEKFPAPVKAARSVRYLRHLYQVKINT